MRKYRMRAALLAGLLLMNLAGCAANTDTAGGIPDPKPQKIIVAEGSPSEKMTSSTAGTESAKGTVSPVATKEPAEKESSASQSNESPGTESPITSAPVKNEAASKPSPTEKPARTEKPKSEETKPTPAPSATSAPSPKPTEPPAAPAPTEPPAPPAATPTPEPEPTTPPATPPPTEAEPAEPEPTDPPAPAFDIDYWISYAQSYAESVGLRLESSATDCWDNPITAGAQCAYLERDIGSRLNRYSRDEDITDVWIWAEPRSDGSYDLYIGYA